jgi:hypothetical protein
MEVDGFESDPGLVRFANELFEKEGMGPGIEVAPWDLHSRGDRRRAPAGGFELVEFETVEYGHCMDRAV